jgi:hypothetical protein
MTAPRLVICGSIRHHNQIQETAGIAWQCGYSVYAPPDNLRLTRATATARYRAHIDDAEVVIVVGPSRHNLDPWITALVDYATRAGKPVLYHCDDDIEEQLRRWGLGGDR